jgi:hypothetical protein
LRTKKIYHYVDPENDIDIKSKEVFKTVNKIIHYPFRPQTRAPKYLSIRKIIYEDLYEPLPKGFLKKCTTGYGFKRELNPLLYSLYILYLSLLYIQDALFKPFECKKL